MDYYSIKDKIDKSIINEYGDQLDNLVLPSCYISSVEKFPTNYIPNNYNSKLDVLDEEKIDELFKIFIISNSSLINDIEKKTKKKKLKKNKNKKKNSSKKKKKPKKK